jgi:hypothetical protein
MSEFFEEVSDLTKVFCMFVVATILLGSVVTVLVGALVYVAVAVIGQ